MTIKLKRIYERPDTDDGVRILVERLWPRGLSKKDAKVDLWIKEAAPSAELRKWFGHDPSKWEEFKKRYFEELDKKEGICELFRNILKSGKATFVFASREGEYNNSVALKEYLENRLNR